MKVLQVCNHFHPCVGGMETAVEDLARNLIKKGHTCDIACLDTCAKSKDKLAAFEEHEGIKIFRFPYLDLKYYKIAPTVLKVVKDYDLIHVHGLGFFSDLLATTKIFHKKPLILTTHGGVFHTKKLSKIKNIYFNYWNRAALRAFDKVIAVSKNDAELFSKISQEVEYIPDAINIEDFQIAAEKRSAHELLFVGRLSKNKRIDRLIEIVALMKDEGPGIKLSVVGEDWEGIQKNLEELAVRKGVEDNVNFVGMVEREKLNEHLSRAGFFVSASEYEGFGISTLEAMGAGCVVVVNDIPSFREFVKSGECGFIMDFSDYSTVAEFLTDSMGKDFDEMRKKAMAAAAKYDWKEIVGEIEKVYSDALESA